MTAEHRLRRRHVVITGAARGIGLATAGELRRRGARVTIGDVDHLAAKHAAEGLGDDVTALPLDVTDPDGFAAFVDGAREHNGPIDVLVNNAGIMPVGAFLESSADLERRSIEINVMGPLTGMRLVLPEMVERGTGQIVNIASTAGRAAIPGGIAYCAAKAAVLHATEATRIEFAGSGVDFTCVLPGFVDTDLVAGTRGLRLIKNCRPEDVATAVARAIERRRTDVYVPRIMGPLLRSQPLLGRRLRDAFNRRMGAYDTFLDLDTTVRAGYRDRMGQS